MTPRQTLIGMALLLAATGCSRSSQRPQIAFIEKTLSNPYWVVMRDSALAAGRDLDLQVQVEAPQNTTDVERQLEILEAAVARHVAGIVIAPTDSRALVRGIVDANRAGVPVIVVDTRLDSEEMRRLHAEVAGSVGSDNYLGGRLAAQALLSAIDSSGPIAVLEGVPGQETSGSRNRGFRSVIDSVRAVSVVASQPADWQRDKGLSVFENILTAHPQIRGLFAANDEMALGAIQALVQRRYKPGRVAVVGFDATDEAISAVRSGWMRATVAQQPGHMARQALTLVLSVLSRKLPANADTVVAVPVKLVEQSTLPTK